MITWCGFLLGLALVTSLVVASDGGLFPRLALTPFRQTEAPSGPNLCSDLVQTGTIAKGSGVILYSCGGNNPALRFPAPHQTVPSATPSFNLPNAAGNVGPLSVWSVGSGVPCSNTITLTSGLTPHLHPGSYDYCLAYNNFPSSGGTIPSFTITWS